MSLSLDPMNAAARQAASAEADARGSAPAASKTVRLAVGLFSDSMPLRDALSVLSEQGLAAHNYCLVGGDNAGSGSAALRSQSLDGYFSSVRPHHGFACRTSTGGAENVPCSSCIAGSMLGQLPANWLSPAQSRRLQSHLQNGGLILIVSSRTPDEQDATSRILLRHSKHGVQTHDFTLRT